MVKSLFKLLCPSALLMSLGGASHAGELDRPPFEAFSVTSHEQPKLEFKFSKAAATSTDPVVISRAGGPLRKADRARRTDLQKVWLHEYVPASYEFQIRAMVTNCGLRLPGKFHACDAYQFQDPATGATHVYHLYLDNWPF